MLPVDEEAKRTSKRDGCYYSLKPVSGKKFSHLVVGMAVTLFVILYQEGASVGDSCGGLSEARRTSALALKGAADIPARSAFMLRPRLSYTQSTFV